MSPVRSRPLSYSHSVLFELRWICQSTRPHPPSSCCIYRKALTQPSSPLHQEGKKKKLTGDFLSHLKHSKTWRFQKKRPTFQTILSNSKTRGNMGFTDRHVKTQKLLKLCLLDSLGTARVKLQKWGAIGVSAERLWKKCEGCFFHHKRP